MKIEDQVCTLEQAKRLKELGIQQQSEFYFRGNNVWHYKEVTDWPNQEQFFELIDEANSEWEHIFSAYTVAELGQMLREALELRWELHYMAGAWFIRIGLLKPEILEGVKHEAHARAAFLIKLLEGQLLTVEETNKRIQQ